MSLSSTYVEPMAVLVVDGVTAAARAWLRPLRARPPPPPLPAGGDSLRAGCGGCGGARGRTLRTGRPVRLRRTSSSTGGGAACAACAAGAAGADCADGADGAEGEDLAVAAVVGLVGSGWVWRRERRLGGCACLDSEKPCDHIGMPACSSPNERRAAIPLVPQVDIDTFPLGERVELEQSLNSANPTPVAARVAHSMCHRCCCGMLHKLACSLLHAACGLRYALRSMQVVLQQGALPHVQHTWQRP